MENCLTSNYTKTGYCPDERDGRLPPEGVHCSDLCEGDSECPDLRKCCKHECGVACLQPIFFNSTNGQCTNKLFFI